MALGKHQYSYGMYQLCEHIVYTNTSEVSILISICRKAGVAEPVLILPESHTDTITTLRFHPVRHNLLLSGSTDGLVNLFDVSQTTEEDAIIQIINNHKSAIHEAGFLWSSNFLFTLGTDETFSIYAMQNEDESVEEPKPKHFGDLRERLNCEYVVTIWMYDQNDQGYIIVGNHSANEVKLIPLNCGEILQAEPDRIEHSLSSTDQEIILKSAHDGEIVRDAWCSIEVSLILDTSLIISCQLVTDGANIHSRRRCHSESVA
jgi:WD repeat-containing protein 89